MNPEPQRKPNNIRRVIAAQVLAIGRKGDDVR